MVEMTGIEPVSENRKPLLSPGAFSDLIFHKKLPETEYFYGSFINPVPGGKAYPGLVLPDI